MWEEIIFVAEGSGYDLHWDLKWDCLEAFEWEWAAEPKAYSWKRGDYIYIPPFTNHQHVAGDHEECRLIVMSNRITKEMGFDCSIRSQTRRASTPRRRMVERARISRVPQRSARPVVRTPPKPVFVANYSAAIGRTVRFAFDSRSTASINAAGLAMPLPAMSWPVPCATEANRIGVPMVSAAAAFCARSFVAMWPWSCSMTTKASKPGM
jgi:hypothetical protein